MLPLRYFDWRLNEVKCFSSRSIALSSGMFIYFLLFVSMFRISFFSFFFVVHENSKDDLRKQQTDSVLLIVVLHRLNLISHINTWLACALRTINSEITANT